MARFEIDDFHRTALDAMDPQTMREIRKKVLWAGAKVLEKETKMAIESHHHVISGDMMRSVAQTAVHEDIDGTWVEVYPQGTDSRGVVNEMKNKIINTGYYNKATGWRINHKDPYVKDMRERVTPRILAVMEKQFELCMEDLNK